MTKRRLVVVADVTLVSSFEIDIFPANFNSNCDNATLKGRSDHCQTLRIDESKRRMSADLYVFSWLERTLKKKSITIQNVLCAV